jgi:sugar/nucleoside kinase (ribokinase family)
MRSGVLAAGNFIRDYVKVVDVYPAQDALANILAEEECNGGAPYNLLVDLAALGADFPLQALGLVGEDATGASILAHCSSLGIDISRLRRTKAAPTSYTLVMSARGSGRRTFFHQRGANRLLGQAHFDFSSSKAKIFHLGYLLLLDSLDAKLDDQSTGASVVLQRASQAGFITSLDVVSEDSTRFVDVVTPALAHCDICFLNEFEAERTTGIPLSSRSSLKDLAEAASRLLRHGVRQWSVIHSADGAYAQSPSGERAYVPGLDVPKNEIRSVVGCGDAFAAGFLMELHQNADIENCLGAGVCAATACLQHETTSNGLKPLEVCLNLADRYGPKALPSD